MRNNRLMQRCRGIRHDQPAVLVLGLLVLVAILGAGGLYLLPEAQSDAGIELVAVPADVVGEGAFVVLEQPLPDIVLIVSDLVQPERVVFPGDTDGLYGRTIDGRVDSCDRALMRRRLKASLVAGRAWAEILHLEGGGIAGYIQSLTPVLLQVDSRVTDHQLVGEEARPFQAVLEAGTAVLIDAYGVPRVRCASGSPLLGPVKHEQFVVIGEPWPALMIDRSVRVVPASVQSSFDIIENPSGALYRRPSGTEGDVDELLRPPAAAEPEPADPPEAVELPQAAPPQSSPEQSTVPTRPAPSAPTSTTTNRRPSPSTRPPRAPSTNAPRSRATQPTIAVPTTPDPTTSVPATPVPTTGAAPIDPPSTAAPTTPPPTSPPTTSRAPSSAAAVVPSVVGQTIGEASATMAAAGLSTTVVQMFDTCTSVTSQSLPAGLEVAPGTLVLLVAVC